MQKLVLFFLSSFLFSACTTTKIPVHEYAIAKAAYDGAVNAEAVKFAPKIFYKADRSFKNGEQLYKDRYYEEARKEFLIAKKLAEKAENEARVKQFNSGEGNAE